MKIRLRAAIQLWQVMLLLGLVIGITGGLCVRTRTHEKTACRIITPTGSCRALESRNFPLHGTSAFTQSVSGTAPTSIISAPLNVPVGQRADLIATFSGELGYDGAQGTGDCYGYFVLDNSTTAPFFPGGVFLVSSQVYYAGNYNTLATVGYQKNAKSGSHTISFLVIAAGKGTTGNCTAYTRSLTVIANVHP